MFMYAFYSCYLNVIYNIILREKLCKTTTVSDSFSSIVLKFREGQEKRGIRRHAISSGDNRIYNLLIIKSRIVSLYHTFFFPVDNFKHKKGS